MSNNGGIAWTLLLASALAGCSSSERLLAFATATTFGLDISLRADDNVNVVLGYDRVEVATVPVQETKDASKTDDAYSVLGFFHVDYGNPWNPGSDLTLKQLFATGVAAQESSSQPTGLQKFLAQKAAGIAEERMP
jgi:hypothetical protein